MERNDLYRDIAERTQGDIYIGVVGPVRTGKSTFIKRFMDLLVLPAMDNEYAKARVTDELPQSGAGRTIMTTQPKFVPNEAVQIEIDEHTPLRVRMVDCVGYMVHGALGFEENKVPRMVRTPWFDNDIPFEQAAEIGTRKVITEHSTIGVVMTTDGSITEIPRANYVEAEERVVREMKDQGKPFIMVLNTRMPQSDEAAMLSDSLAQKYDVPVLVLDVLNMGAADILSLLESVLFEFPLRMVRFKMPGWVQALSDSHYLTEEIYASIKEAALGASKMRDYSALLGAFDSTEHFMPPQLAAISLGTGTVEYELIPTEGLFFTVLGEESGYPIEDDFKLMSIMKELIKAKKEYDRVKNALESVRETGYGLITPTMEDLKLDEPEMLRRGNQYGVRLHASGPSLHLIRADVSCEVTPIVGTEQQSELFYKSLMGQFETDPARIWETNFFGRSLHDLIKEGLMGKLANMPVDVQEKLQQTLQRIINEGSANMICILL